jgi:prepilin-type N-terminal cleavage/methylation domain-containing protein
MIAFRNKIRAMSVNLIFLTLRQGSGRTENQNTGFTLIEAMLAIAIIAIVMTPLMITQGTVVQAVANISLRLQRIFFAQNFYTESQAQADDQKKFALDKKVESPSTQLAFERKPVDSKSALAKINNLVVDRMQASWSEHNKKQKEVLVLFKHIKAQST